MKTVTAPALKISQITRTKQPRSKVPFALSAAALVAVLVVPAAHAASVYWDIDGATAGAGGATPSGTWDGVGSVWSTDSTGSTATSAYTTLSTDALFFSAGTNATGAYTISLATTQNARSLTFEDGTVTISGAGTIGLGVGGGITIASTAVTGATVSSGLTISGSQTFNVAASETLTLNTGTFTRNAGATLNVASTGTVNSTMTNLASGSMVNGIVGPWASFDSGTSTKYATFSTNTIVGLTGTAAATAANVISVAGTFNYDVAAVGTLGAGANINTLRYTGAGGTIAGALTTNGIMNVGGGALVFSGVMTSGSGEMVIHAANGSIALAGLTNSGNLVTFTGSSNVTFNAGTYGGTGGLTWNGSGALLAQAGTLSYTGPTTINGGALQLSNKGTGNFTLNGGMLTDYFHTGFTFSGGLGAGTNQIQIYGNSGFGGGNGNDGVTIGTANSVLQWGSTFFNPTTLKFFVPGVDNLGPSIFGTVTLNNGLDLNGANRTILVNPASGTPSSATATITGVISNTSGTAGLILTGGGFLVLNGANTYNGDTTISSGTLMVGNNTAGTLGNGTYAGNIINNGNLQIYSTAAQTLSGIISGSGTLQKAYGGTLTLSGLNTYTGKTSFVPQTTAGFTVNVSSFDYITSGTYANHGLGSSLGAPITAPNGIIDVGSIGAQAGVTLKYTGAAATGETTDRVINFSWNGTSSQSLDSSGSGLLKFTSPMTGNAAAQSGQLILTGTGTGEIVTLPTALPTGGLSKTGTGTWTLSGANTFTAPTTVSAGKLILTNALALQNSAYVTTGSNGTTIGLDVTSGLSSGTLTLGGLSGAVNLASAFTAGFTGSATNLTLNPQTGISNTYTGIIANTTMGLTKSGAGTQVLSGANSYTGATSITAGTLAIGSAGSLNNTAITVSNSGSTFAVNTTAAGSVALGTTTAGSAGATLNLNGSGTAFSMVDTFIGTTNLQQQTSFSGTALTLNNAALNFELSGATADKLALTNAAATASVTGTNTINLTPLAALTAGTYNLITTANGSGGLDTGGTFRFANGLTTTSGGGGGNTYLLTLNNAANAESVTVSAPIAGGITWTGLVAGNGTADSNWNTGTSSNWATGTTPVGFGNGTTVTFQDTNTVTATNVTNGTVTIQAGGVSPTSTTFNNSAVNYTVSGGAIGGTGGLTKSGTGTVILTGANTYTGTTTITGGTLQLGNGTSAPSLSTSSVITVTSPGNLAFNNNAAQFGFTEGTQFANKITGTGSVTMLGGELTLNTATTNDFSGGFTLSGGRVNTGSNGASFGTGTLTILGGIIDTSFSGAAGQTLTTTNLNTWGGNFSLNFRLTNGIWNDNGAVTISGSGVTRTVTGQSTAFALNVGAAIGDGGNGNGLTFTTITAAFSAANTYSGLTTVNAGASLALSNSLALQNSALLTTTGTVTLTGGLTSLTVGGLSGTVALGTGTMMATGYSGIAALTLNPQTGVSVTYTGAIANGSGAMPVTKTGAGTQTLGGANTFTGGLTIKNGTLIATTVNTALGGTAGAGAVTLGDTTGTNAASLLIGTTGLTYANPITLATNATVGTLTIGNTANIAATTFSGGVAGTNSFTINNSSSTAAANTITFSTVNLTNTGAMTNIGTSTGATTISSNITASTASVTQNSSGSLVLSGTANTYTGATTVSAGTLAITATTGTPLANTAIGVTGTATFTVKPGSGTVSLGNTGTVGAGATLNLASGTTFSMVDANVGTANLVQEGTFAGAALTLGGATLNFDASGANADKLAVSTAATVTGANLVNLTFVTAPTASSTYNVITAASGLNTGGGSFAFGGSGTSTQTVAVGTNSYLLTLVNSAGAEQVTVGTATVITGVTWTGQTNGNGAANTAWNNGITTNWAAGSTASTYNDGTVVTFGDTNAVAGGTAPTGTVVVAAGGVSPTSITVNNTAVNYTISGGAISGTGAITKTGSGTLTLSGTNLYTGGTNINGGILNLGSAQTITGGPLGGTGGTLTSVSASTMGTIKFGSGGVAGILQYSSVNNMDYSAKFSTAAGQAFNIDTNGRSVTFATLLASTGGTLTLNDTAFTKGTLTLTGSASYTGNTTISAGTLAMATNLITTSPNIFIGNGATLGNNAGSFAMATGQTITGTGATGFVNNTVSMGSGGTASNNTISNNAAGVLTLKNLTVNGTGNTITAGDIQSGANGTVRGLSIGSSTTGALTITGGSFTSNGGSSFADLVASGSNSGIGSLIINGGSYVNTGNGGTLNLGTGNGSGTLTLTSGSATIGTLQLNPPNSAINEIVNLDGGTLTVNAITTNGQSGGRLFHFNGGTLVAAGTVTISGMSALDVKNGGANINTNGNSITISDALINFAGATTSALTKSGAGTLTLSNAANTYVGKTTVQNGTLSFTNGNVTATANQSLGTNIAVDLGVASTSSGILNYTGAAGTLAKNINALGNGSDTVMNSGSGALTLSGTVTKNGTTLTMNAATSNINVTGQIVGAAANSDLIVTGDNTTTVSNNNTYNGATTVGTVGSTAAVLKVTGSLSGTTAMTVNLGGTLLVSSATTTSNIIGNGAVLPVASSQTTNGGSFGTTALTSNGGTLAVANGQSGTSHTFASMALNASSILDFNGGGGTTNTNVNLFFSSMNAGTAAALAAGTTTLTINGWSGPTFAVGATADTGTFGDGSDRLIFNTDPGFGLGSVIAGVSFTGFGQGQEVQFGSSYAIVPVPEPATTALIGSLALCALIGYRERHRVTRIVRRSGKA